MYNSTYNAHVAHNRLIDNSDRVQDWKEHGKLPVSLNSGSDYRDCYLDKLAMARWFIRQNQFKSHFERTLK